MNVPSRYWDDQEDPAEMTREDLEQEVLRARLRVEGLREQRDERIAQVQRLTHELAAARAALGVEPRPPRFPALKQRVVPVLAARAPALLGAARRARGLLRR